jgi:hypothetical protein
MSVDKVKRHWMIKMAAKLTFISKVFIIQPCHIFLPREPLTMLQANFVPLPCTLVIETCPVQGSQAPLSPVQIGRKLEIEC